MEDKKEKKVATKNVVAVKYDIHPKFKAFGKPLIAIAPKVWGETSYNLMGEDISKTVYASTKEKKADGSCCVEKKVSWEEIIKGAGQKQLEEYYKIQEAGKSSQKLIIKV